MTCFIAYVSNKQPARIVCLLILQYLKVEAYECQICWLIHSSAFFSWSWYNFIRELSIINMANNKTWNKLGKIDKIGVQNFTRIRSKMCSSCLTLLVLLFFDSANSFNFDTSFEGLYFINFISTDFVDLVYWTLDSNWSFVLYFLKELSFCFNNITLDTFDLFNWCLLLRLP